MSIKTQTEYVMSKFFPVESAVNEYFEINLWGSPKQIVKFAVPRLQNRYAKDSVRRLIFRELKKWYIRHPYFPIYFSKEYNLHVFNLLLRLGWFKTAFEVVGNKEPVSISLGTIPPEWERRVQYVGTT